MLTDARQPQPDVITLADVPELADLLTDRQELPVVSWSMYPLLRPGDRIRLEPLRGAPPAVGDVVVVRVGSRNLCHRVVRLTEEAVPQIVTRGDACATDDEPAPVEAMLGRLARINARPRHAAWREAMLFRGWQWRHRAKQSACRALDHLRRWRGARRVLRWCAHPRGEVLAGWAIEEESRFRQWLPVPAAVRALNTRGMPATLRVILRRQHDTLGHAQVRLTAQREWRIESLQVRFRYRGCGIGARLIETLLAMARATHATAVIADVPQHTAAAWRCLARCGFDAWPGPAASGTRWLHALAHAAHPWRMQARRWALPLYDPRRCRPLLAEERVLQCGAWCDEAQALQELERVCAQPLDWWFIMSQARRHGIVALLYDRLRRLPAAIPPTVLEVMQHDYWQQASINTRRFAAAEVAARLLRAQGIRVVALKGLGVAERYYGNVALRPMQDIDVLVAAADLPAVERVLRAHDYAKLPAAQDIYIGPGNDGHLILEVHPPAEHPFYDMTGVLARAQPLDGRFYDVPSPEDGLLFAGLHMTLHHVWMRLIWIADVARMTADTRAPIRWDVVLERLRYHPARFAMHEALRAAQDLGGAAVPGEVLAALAPSRTERRHAACLRWLLTHPPIPLLPMFVMYGVGRLPSVPLAGLRQRAWPSASEMRRRFGAPPGAWLPLWYAKRIAHLTGRGLATLGYLARYGWHDWRTRAWRA